MKQISFLIMVLLACLWACKPSQPSQVTTYSEDLSIHRPEITATEETTDLQDVVVQDPVELTDHIRAELDSVLSIIVAGNLKKAYWDGYTIQVYNGLNREQAYSVRKAVERMELGLPVRLEYRQPNYKVKVGLYFNQLTAHADLMRLKQEFSASLLIPEKIKLADYEFSD